jgi:hypothetical protein
VYGTHTFLKSLNDLIDLRLPLGVAGTGRATTGATVTAAAAKMNMTENLKRTMLNKKIGLSLAINANLKSYLVMCVEMGNGEWGPA